MKTTTGYSQVSNRMVAASRERHLMKGSSSLLLRISMSVERAE